jgi:hypothetical protein
MRMTVKVMLIAKCLTVESRLKKILSRRRLQRSFKYARKTMHYLVIQNSPQTTNLYTKITPTHLSMLKTPQKLNGNARMKLLQMRPCSSRTVLLLEMLSRVFSGTAGYLELS